MVLVTGDDGFGTDSGTGFAGGEATFVSFWDWVWITFDIGSTGWGTDIEGAGFWDWDWCEALLRQIQVVRWVQNPAAQFEFKERTLLRLRTRGQIKLELEHLGDCPVARGKWVYRVEQPWQLYSSLGPRRRAGPAWIAEFSTFLAGFVGFWFVKGADFRITGIAGEASQEGHS